MQSLSKLGIDLTRCVAVASNKDLREVDLIGILPVGGVPSLVSLQIGSHQFVTIIIDDVRLLEYVWGLIDRRVWRASGGRAVRRWFSSAPDPNAIPDRGLGRSHVHISEEELLLTAR